jgi:hypothetical protein
MPGMNYLAVFIINFAKGNAVCFIVNANSILIASSMILLFWGILMIGVKKNSAPFSFSALQFLNQ